LYKDENGEDNVTNDDDDDDDDALPDEEEGFIKQLLPDPGDREPKDGATRNASTMTTKSKRGSERCIVVCRLLGPLLGLS
jgi:hypothetical protein